MEKRKQEMDPMLPPGLRQPSMETIFVEHCDAFESLNMEKFLTDPWSVEETNTSATTSTAADPNAATLIHRQGSPTLSLPMPLHRKIVDKVWAKMRKERLPLMMNVGEAQQVHELDALPLSSSPSPYEIAASPILEVKGTTTAGLGPCNGEGMEWERGGRGKKGMNETEEKEIERRMKKLIRSRESAARFHAKKQAYTRELEAEVNQLREENARLQEEEQKNWARMNHLLYESMDEQARNNGQKTACIPRRHNSCPWW